MHLSLRYPHQVISLPPFEPTKIKTHLHPYLYYLTMKLILILDTYEELKPASLYDIHTILVLQFLRQNGLNVIFLLQYSSSTA